MLLHVLSLETDQSVRLVPSSIFIIHIRMHERTLVPFFGLSCGKFVALSVLSIFSPYCYSGVLFCSPRRVYEFLESCCCSGDCDCQCEIVKSTRPRDFTSDLPNASGGLLKEFDTWHSHLLPSMNNLRNSNDSNNSESLHMSFWVCAFLPEISSVDQWISGSLRSGCVTSCATGFTGGCRDKQHVLSTVLFEDVTTDIKGDDSQWCSLVCTFLRQHLWCL